MEIPLLTDIVIIFGLAIAVLFACHRIRVPTVVGFLLTGIVVGPYGLGLVKAIHHIEIFAEVAWSAFLEYHLAVLGIMIIAIVIFVPKGVISSMTDFLKRRDLRIRKKVAL